MRRKYLFLGMLMIFGASVLHSLLQLPPDQGAPGLSGDSASPSTPRRRAARGRGRAAEIARSDRPQWQNAPGFDKDVFTFVRVQFDSFGRGGGGFGGWANDYPDCDWNFSFRLQQLTTLRVAPEARTLRLDDPELFRFPFLFMTNMGGVALSDEERDALRRYLRTGGFLLGDDFWAAAEWEHVRTVMREVLPDCEPRQLTLDHPVFHTVYDFKKLPQVPSIRAWQRGLTYEDWHGPYENDDKSPHFWGYFDANDRMMALFCHNNDIADGWEREGENRDYFDLYSHRVSYPLGINIVTYAMSH